MGRPSKLTDKQWEEVSNRALNGEPVRALAREFGIAESTMREKITAHHRKLKQVANQIVEAKQALRELPAPAQITAQRLADDMDAIFINLSSAGKFGAMIARHTLGIAAKQVGKVNPDDPMESADILQGVAALTRVANEASTLGRDLIKTRAQMKEPEPDEAEEKVTRIVLVGKA